MSGPHDLVARGNRRCVHHPLPKISNRRCASSICLRSLLGLPGSAQFHPTAGVVAFMTARTVPRTSDRGRPLSWRRSRSISWRGDVPGLDETLRRHPSPPVPAEKTPSQPSARASIRRPSPGSAQPPRLPRASPRISAARASVHRGAPSVAPWSPPPLLPRPIASRIYANNSRTLMPSSAKDRNTTLSRALRCGPSGVDSRRPTVEAAHRLGGKRSSPGRVALGRIFAPPIARGHECGGQPQRRAPRPARLQLQQNGRTSSGGDEAGPRLPGSPISSHCRPAIRKRLAGFMAICTRSAAELLTAA